MRATNANRVVALWLIASVAGCAEGLPAFPLGSDEPSLIALPPTLLPDASAGTGAAPMEVPMQAGTGAPIIGDPCTRGDTPACPCVDSPAQGQRFCIADAASPSGGFFSECLGCPPPMPDAGNPCSNTVKDGFETATDYGGTDCGPCAIGDACVMASDCMSGACEGELCVPESAGTGGASGASGAGATSGATASGGTGGMDAPDQCTCNGFLACCRRDGSCGTRLLLLCL